MTKKLHVPSQIRRHVLKQGREAARTPGEVHLYAACEEGAAELERQGRISLNSIELHLTNAALGAALDIARGWLDSDNGNNVMAAKSMLKFELEYEPDDPREKRYRVKMPRSLAGALWTLYIDHGRLKGEPEAIAFDLAHMSRSGAGASGRVRPETLGWLLKRAKMLTAHDNSAVKRAATSFRRVYLPIHEQADRLINDYLAPGEDQAPEPERKRLVVVACGAKKSPAPGRIPAEQRYTGNYFRSCLMAAEVMDGPTMVLSAKYGLISLGEEIEDYDVQWGGEGSIRLGAVREQVEALGLEDARVTVLGGERYVAAARQLWPDVETPLSGGIGQQLQQLAGMYGGEALADDGDQEPEGPTGRRASAFREVPGLPGRYDSHRTPSIWYGGKAGRATPEPGTWVQVKIQYTGEGAFDLNDPETGETVATVRHASRVHWAPVGSVIHGVRALIERAPQPAAVVPVPSGRHEVPHNFLELAEEGDTPQARAYWRRRCEEYRRTGK